MGDQLGDLPNRVKTRRRRENRVDHVHEIPFNQEVEVECPDCGESIEVGIYGGRTERSYDSCWNWECEAYHKFSRDRSAETYADDQSTESETTQTKLVTDGGVQRFPEQNSETVPVCPYCGSAGVRKRVPSISGRPSDDKQYRCRSHDCSETFDEPDYREPQTSGGRSAEALLEDLGVDTSQLAAFAETDDSEAESEPEGERSSAEATPDGVDSHPDENSEADTRQLPTVAEIDAQRVDYRLSQRELSRRAGFEEGRFSKIVSAGLSPTDATIEAFVEVFESTDPHTEGDLDSKRGPKPKPSAVVDRGESGRQ